MYAEKRTEDVNPLRVTARNLVTTKQKVWIAKVANVRTAGIGISATIDVVMTDRPAENLVVMTVVTRETVRVRIDMGTGSGMRAAAIGEMVVIMIIGQVIARVVLQDDRVVLLERDWRESETIVIKDPDRPHVEIEIDKSAGSMLETARGTEKETIGGNAVTSTKIHCQKVLKQNIQTVRARRRSRTSISRRRKMKKRL